MIYNLVTTVYKPGKTNESQEIFNKEMIPLFPKFGQKLVGSFRAYTGNMNEVYQLFAYEDLAARQRSREAYLKNEQYQQASAKLTALTVSQTMTLIEPNDWSPMK